MLKRILILFLSFLPLAGVAQPYVAMPAVLGDGAVLQADDIITIWGWANPNSNITVETSWGERAIVKSDYASCWKLRLHTPAPTFEPQSITVSGNKGVKFIVKDILIGQVWLCAGQSNMNWSAAHGVLEPELIESNPSIRVFTVPKKSSPAALDDVKGEWSRCEGDAAKWFSAVGLYFGAKLASELNQPIGLVNVSWGGTPVEVWMRPEDINANAAMIDSWKTLPYSNRKGWLPGGAFNAMISPLKHFACTGVIWYQGESNRGNADFYADEFGLMIEGWRGAFDRELPFYFVQIAPKEYNGGDDQGALVREQQEQVWHAVPKTGMVNISDKVDDLKNIHPKDKRPVGERLAAFALAEVYGKDAGKYKSPYFKSAEIKKNRIIVSFEEASGGLQCSGAAIEGLEIGDSQAFFPAQGMILGEQIVAWSNQVKSPKYVRYAFGLNPGNLSDSAGNPVLPFRSDKTQKERETSVKVSYNSAVELRELKDGAIPFLNRKYPIYGVPKELTGLKMLSHNGGSDITHKITITSDEGGVVMILARDNGRSEKALEGWKPDRSVNIVYKTNDPAKPGILIPWTRRFKKGETVTLEGTEFAGFTLVAPSIVLE